ncbi:helix-turn-helix domain-containing protein [Arthrobacter sp. NPDC093128]|uniref:AraC-like ligand-binding domain-containing protein n=1 Tax=Arthrobacter sp. NPDC093128 TaxID=3154979 RepID=UPI00342F0FFF
MSTLTFDTKSIRDGAERFAYWNDAIERSFCAAESQATDEQNFSARMTSRDIGGIRIYEIESSPLRVHRSSTALKSDPCDDFLFGYIRSGHWYLEQNERQGIVGPGDMSLVDMGRPYRHTLPTHYQAIFLRIPRRMVLSRFANVERMPAFVLPKSSALGPLIGNLLSSSLTTDIPTEASVEARVASGVLDLVCAGFGSAVGSEPIEDNRRTELLATVKNFVQSRLGDPGLTVEQIASEFHISTRTLNRLFAIEDTTAVQWLWKMRLEKSRQMLDDGQVERVTALAIECGFSDFSHFSRCFRKTYGTNPSSLLPRARARLTP